MTGLFKGSVEEFTSMLDKAIQERDMCKHHMKYKPHLGKLQHWERQYHGTVEDGNYCILGLFEGHPRFNGHWGHTSKVIAEQGHEIETLNSRYTLGTKKASGC